MPTRPAKPKATDSDPATAYYVARSSGVIKIRGELYRYAAGRTRVRAGHPLLEVLPDRFEPLDMTYDTIEQATAAPGEKR